MGLGDLFRRVSGRSLTERKTDAGQEQLSTARREQAAAWLAALEAGRLNPPRDIHDAEGWDTYWTNQLEVGAFDQGFSDMMSSDEALPPLLAARGARTILCAGNGLSTEALSLALLGFQVTALDISAVPAKVITRTLRSVDHPVHRIPGFAIGDDDTVTFAGSGLIAVDLCPPIHRSAEYGPRGGGTLSFATGDLMNPDVCPGPFDVLIERRTVQLFPREERIPAVERLAARLAARGVFVSHQHHGGWRPGEPRTHYAESWLASHDFVSRWRTELDQLTHCPRLACLMFTTG